MNGNFLKEAERTVRELEFCREKSVELAKQNSVLRSIVEKRNIQISAQDNKIKELLGVLLEKQKELKHVEKYSNLEKDLEEQKDKIRFLAEANSGLKSQVSSAFQGKEEIIKAANELKKIIIQKNRIILEHEKKIDELTRLLVKADRIMGGLKEDALSKNEKAERISGKLAEFAEVQKKHIFEFQARMEESENHIRKLREEKEEAQKKLVQLFDRYSKMKGEYENIMKVAEEQGKKLAAQTQDSKNASEIYKRLKEEEEKSEKINEIIRQSDEKIKSLENINRQIALRYEEEKAILNGIIKSKDEEIRKMLALVQKNSPPQKAPIGEISRKISIPKHFGPVDHREIAAMVKTALAHGDSIESIKKSLINSGYEKEKIEIAIKQYA